MADFRDPDQPLRIGIVGAARTRQGLGPFLAQACERAGAVVTAVSGRTLAGAERAAAALADQLGHPVGAAADADRLAAAVDALVVASPAEVHEVGLLAALRHSRPCLCEKPLLPFAERERALALVHAFAAHDLLLAENCQWPEVAAAHRELFPELGRRPVQRLAMGLGPGAVGSAMLADSLSHLLSVVQHWADLPPDAAPYAVAQSDPGPLAERNVVTFGLPSRSGPLQVELHLVHSPRQPRPAWLEVDGCRIDRRIGADYQLSFVAGARELPVADPMHRLVARFVAQCRAIDGDAEIQRRAQSQAIAQRAALGAAITAALTSAAPTSAGLTSAGPAAP